MALGGVAGICFLGYHILRQTDQMAVQAAPPQPPAARPAELPPAPVARLDRGSIVENTRAHLNKGHVPPPAD
jgi:hypothetical protein